MKKWDFKLKNSPRDISKKIESALESTNGLVFNINHRENGPITFKMRKRITYPWYLYFLNSIVVNGKLSKTEAENGANVEILFNQHFLWVLIIFTHIILGAALLIAVISEKDNNVYTYLIATFVLAIGVILWIRVQKKHKRNIQEYKTLISDILGL
ncbi:DUF423 domain-containing protein [Costertonia aggregata]|uniref:DUF423 domain-containing protein n=1 Tax=Costertonia aggregata TaxID=343403 RepID=A0A7H9AQY2_9FLAO|nr:DUF423 domain-containing protein [Costertonia aggregata]QLG45901.1 DUF423 domain-containing protein [Costertonia aggregata]